MKSTIKSAVLTTIICQMYVMLIAGDLDKVPFDTSFTTGKLSNGFTYYIKKNNLPPERVYIYLLVNAGAMNERPEQNGLAHFCEHMAFNGTKNFPEHSLRKYLESYGMSFGGGFNAYTSYDRTVYMLNSIPTTNKNLMDSCFLIMYDWAGNVLYEDEEIDKERGVIHEEWRVRGGARRRLRDKTNPVYFNGARYAEHNVIGKLSVIDSCNPDLLRQFYDEWYRIDNQALVVVGDINVNKIKQKIEDLFGQYEQPASAMRMIDYEVPENEGIEVAIATDPEARNISIRFAIRHPKNKAQNIAKIKEGFDRRLYFNMLSNRFSELTSQANPPFINAYSYYGGFSEHLDAFYTGVLPMQDKPIEGLKATLLELERVKLYGFTETELVRAKQSILSSYEKSYADKDKIKSNSLARACFGHFLDSSQSPGLEFNYNLVNEYIPTVTLDHVNTLSSTFFKDDFQTLILHAPEKDEVVVPSKEELVLAIKETKDTKIDAYIDDVADAPLIKEEPKKGSVIHSNYNKDFDGTIWKMSNGATVVWKYTDNKDDEILLRAYSPGGSSLFKTEDLPSNSVVGSAIYFSGLGEFSKTQLKKKLTGKQTWVSPWIGNEEEGFTGWSSIKDFETMMKLVYLNFTAPRKDEEAFEGYKKRLYASLENRDADPNVTFSDSIRRITNNYNERIRIQDLTYFEEADYMKSLELYNDRIQNANDFIFMLLGNIDTTTMKPFVEQYIGGLPSGNREDVAVDNGIRPPEGIVKKRFSRDMEDPKGYSHVLYWGYIPYNRTNSILTSALSYITRIRCTDKVREDEGGTYGVGVSGYIDDFPEGLYKFYTRFNCDPVRVDSLTSVIYGIIDDMKENGPTDEEIQAAKEYLIKRKPENMKDNGYIANNVKKYMKEGYYATQKEYYEDKIELITNESIKSLAQQLFGNNQIEVIMTPTKKEDE